MESPVQVGLSCLNCKKPVHPDEARIFQAVFCCPQCHEIAVRAYGRLEKELRHLLTLAGDSIRVALIRGELQLSGPEAKDIPKSELLRKVIEIAERAPPQEKS